MDKSVRELQNQLRTLQHRFAEIDEAYSKLKQRYSEIDALYALTSALGGVNHLEELIKLTCDLFKHTLKIDHYAFMLLVDNRLIIKSQFGLPEDQKDDGFLKPESIFAEAIETQKPIYISNTKARTHRGINIFENADAASLLCLPLSGEQNLVTGLLILSRNGQDAFSREELSFCEKIAQQVAQALNKILLYEHTKQLSITDELTGVFNRRYFNQRFEQEIQRAKRYQRSIALIMMDIDHFKNYNDRYGHLRGDQALKTVASKLIGILRGADIMARYGGEEFIIMLPEISKEQARKVANKLRREIEKTQFVDEAATENGQLTISLGVAVFPDDAREPHKLVQYADAALYTAKSMGRNCVAWHGMDGRGKPDKPSSKFVEI